MSIQDEILNVYGVKGQKPDEDRQKFLARVIKAADAGTDEQFKKVSKEGKVWVNEGVSAVDNGKPIKDFPDADKPAKAAPAAKSEADAKPAPKADAKPAPKEKPAPAAKEKPAAEAKKKSPPKTVKAPVVNTDKPRGKKGNTQKFREITIKNWTKDRHWCREKAIQAGSPITESTAFVVWYETHSAVKALAVHGMLSKAGLELLEQEPEPTKKKPA